MKLGICEGCTRNTNGQADLSHWVHQVRDTKIFFWVTWKRFRQLTGQLQHHGLKDGRSISPPIQLVQPGNPCI
jgi:hypothetical protein